MLWLLYNMYLLFPGWFGMLGVKIRASNEFPWWKHIFWFLQQHEGHHERDMLPIMCLRQLTFVNMVTGQPSWSPEGIFLPIVVKSWKCTDSVTIIKDRKYKDYVWISQQLCNVKENNKWKGVRGFRFQNEKQNKSLKQKYYDC